MHIFPDIFISYLISYSIILRFHGTTWNNKKQETQLFVDIYRIFIILWVLLEWRGISLQITEGELKFDVTFIDLVFLVSVHRNETDIQCIFVCADLRYAG